MGNGPEMVAMLDNPQMIAILIPIVAIVGGITFVTVVHWLDTQRKEREAYYKAETLRRITEASGEGAKAALDLMHQDDRLKRLKAARRHEDLRPRKPWRWTWRHDLPS